jgi:hypothetical protein
MNLLKQQETANNNNTQKLVQTPKKLAYIDSREMERETGERQKRDTLGSAPSY